MFDLIQRILHLGDYSSERLGGANRSPRWSQIRKIHITAQPECIVCGKIGTILSPNEVHHIILFSQDQSQELNPQNLVTACRRHHLEWCHLGSFKSWDSNIRENAKQFRERVANRP